MTALPESSFRAECNVAEKSVLIDFSPPVRAGLPDAGGHSATGEEPAGSSRNDDSSIGAVNVSLSKDLAKHTFSCFDSSPGSVRWLNIINLKKS